MGPAPYDYTEIRTWRATDECGKQSVFVQNVTVVPAGAPNFTFVPPTITVSCDTDWTDPESTGGPALATSLCGHQVTIQTADEILNDNDCTLRVRRTWTAVDVCGQTATADQLIIVRSEPPAFTFVPAPISVPCGTDWNDFDNTGGDAESISPCGLDVTVESADRATNDDLCDTKIRRSWTVIDSCGHVARAEQIISIVVNQQLILRPFENHTAEVCPQYDGDLGPSKFDDKAVVENLSSCLLDAHLTINSTDTIVASNSSFGTRLIRRSWSVRDICGNEGFTNQYIFVKDIERPELVLEPNTTEVRCSNTSELLLLPDPVLRPLYPSPRTWYLVNRMSLRDVTQDHLYHHTCNGQTVVRTYQAYELTCDMNITLRQYVKVISAVTTTTSTSTTTTSTTTEASTTSSTTTASTTSATPTTSPTTSTGTVGNAFTLATLGAVAAEDSFDSEATEEPECTDCDSNVAASPLSPVMNLADFLALLGPDQSTAGDEGHNMAPTIAPPAGYPGQRSPDNTFRGGGLSHFFNSHSRLGNFKYDPAPASPGHGKAPGHGNSPGLIFLPEPIVVNNPVEQTNEAEATGSFSSSDPMARPLNVIGLMPPKPEQHENVKPNKQPSRPHMPFFGFSSRLRSTGHSDDEFRNPKTPAS
ncbi:uncharacterized protein LOC106169068 [Lingula anatina]|uniref:Uncharacterized protein LOC106169068 n=1 Tax=Lingula anatina TaxID=7574 RepID=A0A1S3J052_LINAN|nr:uncharacterized protein LOC106169068 [Lingula anatina]|eukprot:XP_013403825.1 uncharacterized protein LOC106169068 [Lingula anatina]